MQAQSAFFDQPHVSLLIIIVHRRIPDPTNPEVPTITEKYIHSVFSDVMKHDSRFVQAAVKMVLDTHEQQYQHPPPDQLIVWSDQCSTQFKCRSSFYLMAELAKVRGVPVHQNFTAPGHGKGEVDGAASSQKVECSVST